MVCRGLGLLHQTSRIGGLNPICTHVWDLYILLYIADLLLQSKCITLCVCVSYDGPASHPG